MSKASKMIQAMDQLQITQKPYKAHYLTECDQKVRQQYLQLLFSVVSLEGFNDAQQRIWQLLSQSIGVDGTSSDEMNSELIQTVVQSCVENKLQHVFILDLLVLLRLNTVSDEQARILAELISLFALSNQDVDTLIHLSDLILSISDKGQNLTEFKYETIRHWHEFSYQVLTKELLVAGLNGGRWIQLNDITEVNKPINIDSSSLYSIGEKLISVANNPIKVKDSQFDVNLKATECDINILKTNFSNQNIELSAIDSEEALFEDCTFSRVFEASYDDPTYLNCPSGDLKINKCDFQMENIATINFTGEKLTVENSTFEKCGNPKGKGVITTKGSAFKITDSNFINCISSQSAAVTGSIFRNDSNDTTNWKIINCSFKDCSNCSSASDDWELRAVQASAVYLRFSNKKYYSSDFFTTPIIIENCIFDKSSICLKFTRDSKYKGYSNHIIGSQFNNSPIAYHHQSELIFDDCTFENDGKPNVIEIPQEEA